MVCQVDKALLSAVIFIALKKAFDTVDHKMVLQKLANYVVHGGDDAL